MGQSFAAEALAVQGVAEILAADLPIAWAGSCVVWAWTIALHRAWWALHDTGLVHAFLKTLVRVEKLAWATTPTGTRRGEALRKTLCVTSWAQPVAILCNTSLFTINGSIRLAWRC